MSAVTIKRILHRDQMSRQRRYSVKHLNFTFDNSCQVFAIAHRPRDAFAAPRELRPLALLVGVLFDQNNVIGQLDVTQAGACEFLDAAPAAKELLESDEQLTFVGSRVVRLRFA